MYQGVGNLPIKNTKVLLRKNEVHINIIIKIYDNSNNNQNNHNSNNGKCSMCIGWRYITPHRGC